MSKSRAQYIDRQADDVESFSDSLFGQAVGESNVLDSTKVTSNSKDILSQNVELPQCVSDVMKLMPDEDHHRVLDAVQYGMAVYKNEHGVLPTADVIMAALQQGSAASSILDRNGRPMDPRDSRALDAVGSTSHHDQISAQPNRIVVAITSAIAEAIPFATYLPTDIGSNEARLGIVSHQAGSNFGGYTQAELMDGVNIGKTYLAAERRVAITLDGPRTAGTGAFTTQLSTGATMAMLRGRTKILVAGYPVAYESYNTSATVANSPISGSARIASVDYSVGGYITVATGVIALTFSPALPAGTLVEAEGIIDYEAAPTLAPRIVTQVNTYSLFASPWRALADQTVDSKTQYTNELSLDLQSENLMAIRNQFAMERHYASLFKLLALAKNNQGTYDFAWPTQSSQKTRARIWQDAMAVIGVVDQVMAENTMDHGITHMYVGKNVAAQLQSLPSDIFVSSGIQVRPGIFRLGRLFGRYEVYYTPKLLSDSASASQILCIGRSTQVSRCPIVMGDAVAPTYLPISMQEDMKYRQGFYARNFTEVNPHYPSAMGAALINITNLS